MTRLDGLNLLIEPTTEEQTELTQLRKQSHAANVALDRDNDPDPDGEAARQHMNWLELYRGDNRRNERTAANAERQYARQSQRMMNGFGLRN